MLRSVKKFRPASNEFIYPYLIRTDSTGLIVSVCESLASLLSGFGISDYLYKNITDIFSWIGHSHPPLATLSPTGKLPEIIDLFLKYPGKKSNLIRWICAPVSENDKPGRGWQLTGMEIPHINKSAIVQQTERLTGDGSCAIHPKPLRPYSEYMANILNGITDGYFVVDENFTVISWNHQAEQITGVSADKIIGNNILEKMPELADTEIYKAFLKAIKKKTTFSSEQYAGRLGLWLEMNVYPYGRGLFVYFKDVTKRKKQEMLLELEKKVLEINSDPKASIRNTTDYFLEGIEKIFPGMLCSVLILDDDGVSLRHLSAPNLPTEFSSAIDGVHIGPMVGSCGTAVYTKKRVIVNDIADSPLWENYKDIALQFNIRSCWSLPVLNARGDVLATFAMYYTFCKSASETELNILDRAANLIKVILENKRAEEKVKIINERYILATKATNDVIWDWDMKSKKAPFWGEGFYSQFGFKQGSKVNNREFWQSHIHPDDSERVVEGIKKFVTRKQTGLWLEEYRFKKANGKFVLISDRGFLIYDKDGEVIRMVGSMQDITDKREMEKKLLKQELNKQKLIVQAVVDAQEKERAEIGKELHDNVNQILSTTKLYLELARSDESERLNLIARSAKNIHLAINEIRNISRSLVPPSIGDLGLLDSINDLIENIKAIKAIHVEFYPVGAFEEKISKQQKLTLFRIIQEQVNNVLKHSEAKNLIIELILVENENRIELNITDDGKGFESAKMKNKNGLGLSNIINRADLFGGRVSIVSSKGQGCKLSVHVPIHNL